jgi:hypothetical protein
METIMEFNGSTWGTNQHYLPACVIGRFTTNRASGKLRNQRVMAWRRGSEHPHPARADKICSTKGLYDFSDGWTADRWDYECSLTRLFDLEEKGERPDFDYFVHDIVPYVSCLFVRGLDFTNRHDSDPLLKSLGDKFDFPHKDNVNACRLIELQRMLAPMLTFKWFSFVPQIGTTSY